MFPFLKYKKYYFIFSGALLALSIFLLAYFGIDFGIDFVGGNMIRYEYKESRPAMEEIAPKLAPLGLRNFSFRTMGEKGIIIKIKEIDEKTKSELYYLFSQDESVDINTWDFEKVGASVGKETERKAFVAIGFSILAIVIYVAWAFRKIAGVIRSWEYGLITIIALIHDVLISFGVVVLMNKFMGVEFSVPLLTAILTILGYSVNDSIVIFDRMRENLFKTDGKFSDIADKSLNQTFSRSVNTTFTTILVLLAIFFFGGQGLRDFSLLLIVGMFFGAYSSIFIAMPLLVWRYGKKQNHLTR